MAFGVFLPLFNKSCVRLFISVPEMAEEGVVIAIAEELAWIGIFDCDFPRITYYDIPTVLKEPFDFLNDFEDFS